MNPISVEAEKIRIQFDMLPERVEDIRSLMLICGVETRKDLFNNAVTLLEWAVSEVKKGNEIAALNKENKSYEIVRMPILLNAAKRASMKNQSLSSALEERQRTVAPQERASDLKIKDSKLRSVSL